jgi:dolichyl-phosphate beta-glucosyltransferase
VIESGRPYLSVVVPVSGGDARIGETLRRIEAYLSLLGRPWEAIVSSDGSLDRTEAAVRSFAESHPFDAVRLVSHPVSRGRGAAARRGVLEASGERVLVTEASLRAPIKEVEKLLAALNAGYDVAIGSRALRSPGCDVRQRARSRAAEGAFNALVRATLAEGFRDYRCAFKCYTREAARRIFAAQTADGPAFEAESVYLAVRMGYRVKEVPVMWSDGGEKAVLGVREAAASAAEILRLRAHYLRHPVPRIR